MTPEMPQQSDSSWPRPERDQNSEQALDSRIDRVLNRSNGVAAFYAASFVEAGADQLEVRLRASTQFSARICAQILRRVADHDRVTIALAIAMATR